MGRYGAIRRSSRDGACGVHGYPCVHRGVDLFGRTRDVIAPDGGHVAAIADGRSAPWTGYGPGIVVIAGDSGKYLLLAHLDRASIDVEMGERVSEGQYIGRFDAGIAHTHFEVRNKLTGPSESNTSSPDAWVRGVSLVVLVALGVGAWWITRWWSGQAS